MAQPLGRQIVILNVCLLVPVFAVIAWAARLTYREQVAQLQLETQTMAVTVVAYLNRTMAVADGIAAALALHPAVRSLDVDALDEVLPELLRGPMLSNLMVADADGNVVGWARASEPGLVDDPVRDWLKRVAAASRPMVSPLLADPNRERHALIFGYPVRDPDRRVVAVIGLQVHLEAVESVLASIPLPEGSVVTVTDEDSVVLARSHDSSRFVGRPIESPESLQKLPDVPDTVVRTGVDGIERAFGNARVERGPWLVSAGIPTSVATARTLPSYWRNLGIALTVTLLTLALEFFIVRRYLGAFAHLERAADRVADGDLRTLEPQPMPSRELDLLQQSFSDMVDKLRAAQAAVAAQVAEERRMREEVQSLQRQVMRQERLAAIGVLVSGVAHELNNPLQAILGFADLLQMRTDLPDSVRADLSLIQKESTRASAIIRNLSRFGRQQSSEPMHIRLRDVVASVEELRQRKLEEQGIALDVDARSEATVLAVFTELQQVLLNFVINAEQALLASNHRPNRIVIRTHDADGRAHLEVEDTGSGVPADDEARLFQPFFTTKPVGEGTGLGLSVSYGIIESHGGTIGYRRGAAGGAVFYFHLPVAP